MPRVSGTRICFWFLALLCLTTCGCSWLFDNHQYDSGPTDFLSRPGYLTRGYPLGPVNQQFTCFGTAHRDADALVQACFEPSKPSDLKNCMKTCETENDQEKRGTCRANCLLPTMSEQSDLENDHCVCSSQNCTEDCIDAGLECTAATRNSYADFLNCREDFQTLVGFGVASLAAASAAVTVGVSALAGTALGATAAGGAGLDYIAYSPAKTQAYANATAQLQCVLYDSSTLTNVLPELYDSFAKLQAALLQPSPPLPCPLDSIISLPQRCIGVRKDDLTLYNDLLAEDAIALQQACAAQTSVSRIGRDIFATTRNIDVRAFAAAKNGIPTPTTIQTAMQTASTLPGSSGSSSAASSKVQPASASNPTFQLQGFGKSNPFRSNSTPTATPTCDLESAQAAAARFRQILRQAQLPQPGFPDCMALSASTPSASSSPSAGSSTSSSSGSGGSGGGSGSSGGGGQSATAAQKPVAVPFQVLPAAAPSTGGGQDLRTEIVQVPVTKSGGSTVIKIIGGTPPYYAYPLNGASIIHETETDPFVSFQVQVPFPAPPSPNAQPTPPATPSRVLFADQAGSQQFVDLIAVIPTSTPTATPTPCLPSKGSYP